MTHSNFKIGDSVSYSHKYLQSKVVSDSRFNSHAVFTVLENKDKRTRGTIKVETPNGTQYFFHPDNITRISKSRYDRIAAVNRFKIGDRVVKIGDPNNKRYTISRISGSIMTLKTNIRGKVVIVVPFCFQYESVNRR